MEASTTLNLVVVGYAVSLPVVIYGLADLARIPARLYNYTPYSRAIWVLTILAGYACFGIGGVLMTAVWIRSAERSELREDLTLDARWEHPAMSDRTRPDQLVPRAQRRRERRRRHRLTLAAVSLPVLLAVAATATRVS